MSRKAQGSGLESILRAQPAPGGTPLGSENRAARRGAVEAIVESAARGDRRSLATLRTSLESPNPRVRWAGVYGLAHIGDAFDARAVDVLLDALSSADSDLRWASARMLASLGLKAPEPVRRKLVVLARGGDSRARRMALYALRYLGAGGEEILSLIEDAARVSSTLVRLAALSLLASLNDSSDRAAAVALGLADVDPDPGVRRAAVAALGRIGNRSTAAIEALSRKAADGCDGALARAAERSLRRLGG